MREKPNRRKIAVVLAICTVIATLCTVLKTRGDFSAALQWTVETIRMPGEVAAIRQEQQRGFSNALARIEGVAKENTAAHSNIIRRQNLLRNTIDAMTNHPPLAWPEISAVDLDTNRAARIMGRQF